MKTPKLKQRMSWLVKHGLFTQFLGVTANDMFTQVKKIITADVRALRMAKWFGDAEYLPPSAKPTCGTVCCVGGWIDHLTNGGSPDPSAWSVMLRRLGIKPDSDLATDLDQLFFGPLVADPEQGTPKHAAKVIVALNELQKKYKTELQAALVTPVTA